MNDEELKLSEDAFRWIKTNYKKLFIDSFLKARENVNKAKATFGQSIELNLIIKDFEKDLEQLEINIENIDRYIKKVTIK